MIRLIQEFGAHAGRQLVFDQDCVRIGRAPTNEVAFDPHVDLDSSGSHCEIVRESGGYMLRDLSSRNGTFVNGTRVHVQRLQHGDLIECGHGGPRLRVELAPTSPSSAWANGPAAAGAQGARVVPVAQQLAPRAAAPAGLPAVAAVEALAPDARVGKRTVAMMINAALVQAARQRRPGGVKTVLAALFVLLLAGGSIGGYVVWQDSQGDSVPVVAPAAAAEGISPGERISAQFEGAIYMLAAERQDGAPQGFCTGFAVTQDLVATNAHCVEVSREMLQRGGGIVALRNSGRGARVPVQPVYQDPRFHNATEGLEGSGFDVGLMRASVPLPLGVRLASLEDALRVRPGAQIYVYGFPGLTMNEVSPVATLTEGVINRTTDFFDRAADPPLAQKVQHTAQTTSGSSGSPIFLANGTVIGINAGSLADEERQSILDPRSGQRVSVEVNRSSNFKYGMRADLIRQAIQLAGESVP